MSPVAQDPREAWEGEGPAPADQPDRNPRWIEEEMSDGSLRTTDIHAPCRRYGRGGEALPGTRVSGAPEGWPGQETRRIFPERYRHDQSARAFMEIRRRFRPPHSLGRGLYEQGFCRGLRLEV